jgi:hypothetical protein
LRLRRVLKREAKFSKVKSSGWDATSGEFDVHDIKSHSLFF